MEFDRQAFGPEVAELLPPEHRNDLGPGTPNSAVRIQLERLSLERLVPGRPIADQDLARCCLAGLWLYHDFLDESHQISQEIETPEGSYWHGIMHRREPDYSNSKYWFRRVGQHPIFKPLRTEVLQLHSTQTQLDPSSKVLLRQSEWNPYDFVDLCQAAVSGRTDRLPLCQEIQELEWQLLFTYCYTQACE